MLLQFMQPEMDRRGWPWKKKSSEKTAEKANASELAGSQGDQVISKTNSPLPINPYYSLGLFSSTVLTIILFLPHSNFR